MDERHILRLCDGLTGAALVSAVAGAVAGSARGAILCAGVAVIAQVIRAEAKP